MKPILFLHPYCLSSLRLLNELKTRYSEGLRGKLDTRMLTAENQLTDPFRMVPSVPALMVKGGIVGLDPLEAEYVTGYIERDNRLIDKHIPHSLEDAFERFSKTIFSSSYILIPLLLNPPLIKQLVDNDEFLEAATRVEEGLGEARHYILSRLSDLMVKIKDVGLRITAYNYLREALMAYGAENIAEAPNVNHLILWLNAKNSIGRAYMAPGNPHIYSGFRKLARGILELLEHKMGKYMDRLTEEEEKVRSYWRELGLARAFE